MIPGFHPLDLLIILAIALLIFGPKKLPEMGEAIGKSIKQFKKGVNEITEPNETKDSKSLTDLESIEREIANKRAAAEAELRAAEAERRAAEAERQHASANSEPVYSEQTSGESESSRTE
ncbi:MAG TPA: twin-arginine translocase TatA/TatE family subunit [Ktedonobacteraceae bacterium]|jgi:sec-independent protein translocase protein TatA